MSNKMALDALTAALDAMEHMANTLNNMDAVDEDEDAQHDAAFEAVRAAIAALQAEPQGWRPISEAPLFVPLQDPVPPAILYSKEYGVCMGAAGRDQFGYIYAHITNVAGSVGDIVTHFHALPATPPKD